MRRRQGGSCGAWRAFRAVDGRLWVSLGRAGGMCLWEPWSVVARGVGARGRQFLADGNFKSNFVAPSGTIRVHQQLYPVLLLSL